MASSSGVSTFIWWKSAEDLGSLRRCWFESNPCNYTQYQKYCVNHNSFKFTIKFLISDDVPAREVLQEYIKISCDNMEQPCIEPGQIIVTYIRTNTYLAHLDLIAKDYGVPQVGVDIVAAWIQQLYLNCDGFAVDAVVVHPKNDAKGAVVRWDYTNNCPIVKLIK